jgi:cobalamin biosynthesis Mg chelatase CobN
MSVRKPTGGTSHEWSNPNSNISYLTKYSNAEKSDVKATNSPKLTTSQLEALSQGSPVSSGPSLTSTGGPSTGAGTPGQSPNNASTSPSGNVTTVATVLPGETSTPAGTTTPPAAPSSAGIPVLWVVLGVVVIVLYLWWRS